MGLVQVERHHFEIDVSVVAPAGATTVSGDLHVATVSEASRRTLLCCVPGGGMSRRYFDLEVPASLGNYSMARHLASRGHLVAVIDHLGVGESSRPDDGYTLTPQLVAEVNAFVVDALVEQLRTGGLEGLDPIEVDHTIGVGHSAGAVLTVHQQARHRTHAAIALLGFGGQGLPEHLTDDERAVAGDPDAIRSRIVDLVKARFGEPLPMPKRGSSGLLVGSPMPAEVHAALVSARTNLLAVVGLSSMLPGSMLPDITEIDVPVFIGVGGRDIAGSPGSIPASFPGSDDVTLFVLDGSGHNHNVDPQRERLWERLSRWASDVR